MKVNINRRLTSGQIGPKSTSKVNHSKSQSPSFGKQATFSHRLNDYSKARIPPALLHGGIRDRRTAPNAQAQSWKRPSRSRQSRSRPRNPVRSGHCGGRCSMRHGGIPTRKFIRRNRKIPESKLLTERNLSGNPRCEKHLDSSSRDGEPVQPGESINGKNETSGLTPIYSFARSRRKIRN